MKLRRTMAVAAATAVMAPVALLAAPAGAYADGTPAAVSPGTGGGTPAASRAPVTTPGAGATAAASPGTAPPATAPPVSESPTASPSGFPSASSSPSGSPSVSVPPGDCPLAGDGATDPAGKLRLSISGLPGRIVAGSGWHPFSITAANPTDRALGSVEWLAVVDNHSESDDPKDWLVSHALLQFFDQDSRRWVSLSGDGLFGHGIQFGETRLGARSSVDIRLRVNIGRDAPAGKSFAFGFGGYLDAETGCVHSSYADRVFTVLAAGSTDPGPGEAEPGKGEHPHGAGGRPAGGAEPQDAVAVHAVPGGGSLAETGAPSAVPVIALTGVLTAGVGAIAVTAVRRRGTGGAG